MIKVEITVVQYEYEMSVELVLPQSRCPAVDKYEYEMGVELVLPQSRTRAVEKNEGNECRTNASAVLQSHSQTLSGIQRGI